MKKIVGILSAAAVLAASVFALDASAAIKFNGSLFDVNFAENARPKFIKVEEPKAQKGHGQTGIDLNVSTDKAGASLIIGNGYGGNNDISYQGYKLWVKPIDAIKINLGNLDYCLNKESIDYAGCINGTAESGLSADISVSGLTINLILNPGLNKNWFDGEIFGNTAAMVKYGADFGTIGAAWIGEPDTTAKKSFAKNTLSVGYSNTFGGVSMFADAALIVTDKLTNVKADAFAKGNVDAFGYAAYVDFDLDVVSSKVSGVQAKAELTYALDSFTPYLYVKNENVLADKFKMTVKPGVRFNIGAASVDIAADFTISAKKGDSALSVPFGVSMGF